MTSITLDTTEGATALIIFAHGAGADMNSQYLMDMTHYFNAHQCNVLRFNFPYMDKRLIDGKRRPPDRMPALIECFEEILEKANKDLPIFIGGKSMGGRVAATLAANKDAMQLANVKGVLCLGYPFHPAKKQDKLRLTPLQETCLPVLILQGERDALGNKSEIAGYDVSSLCQINYFADGDHDLKPRVKSGYTLIDHQKRAADKIKVFIDENR